MGYWSTVRRELGLRLLLVQPERLAEFLRRVRLPAALADDLDRLVERVEDDREAFEDVDPPLELPQLVLEPPADGDEPEVEEVLE